MQKSMRNIYGHKVIAGAIKYCHGIAKKSLFPLVG